MCKETVPYTSVGLTFVISSSSLRSILEAWLEVVMEARPNLTRLSLRGLFGRQFVPGVWRGRDVSSAMDLLDTTVAVDTRLFIGLPVISELLAPPAGRNNCVSLTLRR